MSYQFDIIHLLAAGIKQLPSGKWVSTDLTLEDDRIGSPGGTLRILASGVLLRAFPESVIFTGGGKGYDVPDDTTDERPLLSAILSDELIEEGVPPQRIVLEHNSNNTYQELQELERYVATQSGKRVGIVTNRWHARRLNTILEMKFPKLVSIESIEIQTAEDILIADDSLRWQASIDSAYQSDWIKKRVMMEEKGIAEIKAGTYQFR